MDDNPIKCQYLISQVDLLGWEVVLGGVLYS